MNPLTRRDFLRLLPAGTAAALLVGCGRAEESALPTVVPTPDALSPEYTARDFLSAWQQGNYDAMYVLLTEEAQTLYPIDDFVGYYQMLSREATLYEMAATVVGAARLDATTAAADFDVLYKTRLAGDITARPRIPMYLNEAKQWRIAWSPAMILPSLGADNRLRMFPRTSTRGVIYDRKGQVIATQGAVVTLGVVPGEVADAAAVNGLLSELLGRSAEEIGAEYAGQPETWFIPIGDISFEASQANYERLQGTAGIALRERASRAYPKGATGAHLVGYIGTVSAEELSALGERGYQESDIVGKMGIEKGAEALLAGKKGGRLAVLSPEGAEVETVADVAAVQSRSLYMSIDFDLQLMCEEVLGERKGSIAIADVATGQLLAMATWPRFDPNRVLTDNAYLVELANDANQPLLNRPAQGAYPSGSLFKIVTMSAGLEKAGLPRTDPHLCTGVWTELGFPMACWKESGHGNIDLFHGLEQSCNVVFFETGQSLYGVGETALQEMAATYGIGQLTGVQMDENPGLLPDPAWKAAALDDVWVLGDTVNLSIGQGFLQTTPLQMLRVSLAVASGWVRPLSLISSLGDPLGASEPEPQPTPDAPPLAVSAERLATVREAMRAVAVPPMGTASGSFGDFPIPIAGKTGTAETVPGQDSHAWFSGYAPYDQPQIAFVGMVEYGGEGSGTAAPMMRELLRRFYNVAATEASTTEEEAQSE